MPNPHTPKPPYSAAFRQQMVELVQSGRNPNELAREFGCHVTSILSWVRKARLNLPAGAATPPVPLGTTYAASASPPGNTPPGALTLHPRPRTRP